MLYEIGRLLVAVSFMPHSQYAHRCLPDPDAGIKETSVRLTGG
jgi:hypothetical protein